MSVPPRIHNVTEMQVVLELLHESLLRLLKVLGDLLGRVRGVTHDSVSDDNEFHRRRRRVTLRNFIRSENKGFGIPCDEEALRLCLRICFKRVNGPALFDSLVRILVGVLRLDQLVGCSRTLIFKTVVLLLAADGFQELALLRKLFFKHRNALDTILHIGSPLEDGKVCVVILCVCFL